MRRFVYSPQNSAIGRVVFQGVDAALHSRFADAREGWAFLIVRLPVPDTTVVGEPFEVISTEALPTEKRR